jgi:hypothetical protein
VGVYCETLHLARGNRAKFTAIRVPRHFPLVLIKVGWTRGKTFGSEEGIDEKRSKDRS